MERVAVSEIIAPLSYVGNNSTVTAYAITFRFDDNSWLRVYVIDSTGARDDLALGVDYTLAGDGSAGTATLKTLAPVPVTSTVHLEREAPPTQGLVPQVPVETDELEAALDRLALAIQDVDAARVRDSARALQFPPSEPVDNPTVLPAPGLRRGKVLHFDETTGELALSTSADVFSGDIEAATDAAASATSSAASAAQSAETALDAASQADDDSISAAESAAAAQASAEAAGEIPTDGLALRAFPGNPFLLMRSFTS